MREVTRDNMWNEEDKQDDFIALLDQINTTLLVQTSLLMRLYDVTMHILQEKNPDAVQELLDLHGQGGHYNPEIFYPAPANGEDSA